MRLRNIPIAKETVMTSPYCINNPSTYKGRWQDAFPLAQPLSVEIGTGKGRFLMELAALHPKNNYLGIERYSSVLLRALQKMEECPLPNLKFICMDAADLTEVFDQNEVSLIYLNFSDPWPKERHAKRRLTSRQFFERYDRILKENGQVEFKTDNHDLFLFSTEEIPAAGWHVDAMTYDLHHDEKMNQNNIMTEYEEKFSSKGNPIYKLVASR